MKALFLAPAPPSSARYGTEVVAYGLAAGLAAVGIDVHVAYHGNGTSTNTLTRSREGLPLHELGPLPAADRQMLFSMRTPRAPGLDELLSRLKPDIVQVLGLTATSINRRHVEIAKAHGSKVVLWHNVPGLTCLQTGLLFEGRVPCDGEVRIKRCTQCRLHVAGVPRVAATLLSCVGLPVVDGRSHRLESILAAKALTVRHAEAVTRALGDPDAIQVGALWAREVLRRNGVPESKLHLIRPGVNLQDTAEPVAIPDPWSKTDDPRPLRMIYWGRVHRSKGIHSVLEALALRPKLRIEFAAFGDITPNNAYCDDVLARAAADGRTRFHGRITPEQVVPLLRTADVAIIPSRWHETGPLTVFEAQAAGLPIIGANRGGVGELCTGPGARLFTPEDAESLARVLDEVSQPGVLDTMRRHVDRARTMTDVRDDVARLYNQLMDGKVN